MKKALLLLLVLASALVPGKAQSYVPLLDDDNIWLVRRGNGDTLPDFYYLGFTGQDVVFDSITYRQLYRSSDMTFGAGEEYGGIREDVANQRVYFYDPTSNTERTLYDFSLNVGDTVDNAGGFQMTDAIVHSVDSILIDGTYRKHIHFRLYYSSSEWTAGSWIEGVGNSKTGGLLYSPTALPTCDCGDKAVCYSKNGNWDYHNDEFSSISCDDPTLNIELLPVIGKIDAVVYPNPVSGTSMLQLNTAGEISRADVYSMTGSLVQSYITPGTGINISNSKYPAGQYYYRLQDNNGNTTTGRFIIE